MPNHTLATLLQGCWTVHEEALPVFIKVTFSISGGRLAAVCFLGIHAVALIDRRERDVDQAVTAFIHAILKPNPCLPILLSDHFSSYGLGFLLEILGWQTNGESVLIDLTDCFERKCDNAGT